jgi:hypothetical protein
MLAGEVTLMNAGCSGLGSGDVSLLALDEDAACDGAALVSDGDTDGACSSSIA